MNINNYSCDFCGSEDLEMVYGVPESKIGMIVTICNQCGLTQSLPTKLKETKIRNVSTSSTAGWGNVRHGKSLRFKSAIPILDSLIPWSNIKKVLDVGSNRGDFIKWIHETKKRVDIVCVEPDDSIVADYNKKTNLTLYIDKLEEIKLIPECFDLVYCSHTLEHADSASTMLKQIYNYTKVKGYLFLEVPNIDGITTQDIVEEFFIDKHRFHFNLSILSKFVNQMGFEVIYGKDRNDIFNITLLLQKQSKPRFFSYKSENDMVAYNKNIVGNYIQQLNINRNKLKEVVDKIDSFMNRQRVAFWGGGRIFDALVRYGNLKTDQLCCVVDEYLWNLVPKVHGILIRNPVYLKIEKPDVIIILARSSEKEIITKARSYGFRKIITFNTLIQQVM